MQTLIITYLLKTAFCLAVFYLFYRLWLSKETFHRFNRILLIGMLLVAFIIPTLKVSGSWQFPQIEQTIEKLSIPQEEMKQIPISVEAEQPAALMESERIDTESTSVHFLTPAHFLWLYGIGILLLIGRHLGSVVCICRLIRRSEKKCWKDGIKLAVHQQDAAPFSWKRWIVLSQRDLEEYGEQILAHEYAHIRNGHFWDLVVAEVCLWLQWFNPAMWLIGKELRAIHEFEADESVLKAGIDAKQYQLLLIQKAVGTRLYSMVNSFDHSSLKKRITMMLKEKSKPRKQLKYLIVLPLAAVAVVLFARPNVLDVNDSLQDNMIVDTLYQHFDKIPVQKSYAESDTVQILKLDPTFALPVGFAGWSMSTTNSDGPSPCNRKAAFMKEKGGMIRLSSTIPWDKEDLEQFADEAKASMLKSLNEIYGKKEKKQNISGFTTSSSVTTSQFSAASYGVKDFFQIYCKEGEGIGYDGQLILLDGKEISYQQLQKQSIDDLVGAHEVYPSSTNLKKVFGKQAKKGVWVLVSKKNPSYWDEFCKKLQ